jgi:N,N'-diacetylbacillosaminyl-diphospho-undecaprenol alpha-1,3-N-acetylgalactosaminyltransferase
MKVAIVCPDGRSVLLFCKGLIVALVDRPGIDVIVLTEAGESRLEIEGLGARCIDVPLYRFFSPFRDLVYMLRLARLFRHEHIDAVYNISTKPNIFGSIAARVARVKWVVSHVVGLGSMMKPATSWRDRKVQSIFLGLYRIACGKSDRIWFFNPNDLAFFEAQGLMSPNKSLLTNTFLDVAYYSREVVNDSAVADVRRELGFQEGDRVVLMVARMIWPKGIKEFVEAAKHLVSRHQNWRFVLIAHTEKGSPDEVPASYIAENTEGTNLVWIKYRTDLRPYYLLADIAVLPTYYREAGHPRALLEAMAMGKPVITTDSVDCRGAVEPEVNGYWVPVRDARSLADAIERLMLDADKLREFGEQSRARAVRLFNEKTIIAHALSELGFLYNAMARAETEVQL